MSLITFSRNLLRRTGFDIVRYSEERQRPFPVLPMVVERLLRNGVGFNFVQVGANDGMLDDPIRNLIIRHRISGVLVEPLPDLYEKLRVNYVAQPQLIFENVAITRSEALLELHRVKSDVSVPHHWHGIASFKKGNLIAQGVPPALIEPTTVRGISMSQLLQKHGLVEVGLLQVDTEGHDLEVIRSTFEAEMSPALIHYENCWLLPSQRAECKLLLEVRGYYFLDVGKDTLAVRIDKLGLLED